MIELRIKQILQEKGMTAKGLAESMGKSPQYINNIINGGKGASINTLQAVATALDVPIYSVFADYKPDKDNQSIVCPHCGKTIEVEVNIK